MADYQSHYGLHFMLGIIQQAYAANSCHTISEMENRMLRDEPFGFCREELIRAARQTCFFQSKGRQYCCCDQLGKFWE